MSVEIEGIKGYEYQYIASVYISLLYIKKDSVKIYIEDTEDARIVFEENSCKKELFIQAKKHNDSISFDDVCSWLGHFGERQSEKFLFSRIADENCFSIFFSNGRCEDKVLRFVRHDEFECKKNSSFDNNYIDNVKDALLNLYNSNTKLSAERKDNINDFFNLYKKGQVGEILSKISIVEQFSLDDLLTQISETLNKKFVVRSLSIDYVIKLLDECVRKGRDTGNDIASDIKNILNTYSQRILPDSLDYIEVPNQDMYLSVLEEKNVLLLTGVPFCGKTSLAKAIAQFYAQDGYEVKQTSEFDGDDGALTFFNNYTDDKRLLLLEDPFGAMQSKPDKVECVHKIRKLITENMAFHRKLIVTTRKDILYATFDKSTIDECSLYNNCWWDLTMNDINFAHIFWDKLYGSQSESNKYFEQIKNWIEINGAGVFLEIGEVRNLYRLHTYISELEKISIDKVILEARISSKTIMEKVKMGGADSVRAFLSLGFCCNTMRAVSIHDLEYVLSNSKDMPALIERKSNSVRSISFGGRETSIPSYPQYCDKYKIDSNILFWIQQFEKQGLIFRNKLSKEIYFAHPIFYYASKLLLLDELENQWECDEIMLLGSHAISTLNKHVNLCALEMLWYSYESNCNFQDIVLNNIFNSINSIYPATKDKAILLLEKNFDVLTSEQEEVLINAIGEYEFDHYLLWNDDEEPFINPNDNIELGWDSIGILREESPISIDEINRIKNKKEATPKLVYDILNSMIQDDLSLDFLNVAFSYDESVIREKAIYLIFKNCGNQIQDANIYLSDFDNCNVIFELFRGALQAWFLLTDENRNKIVKYFCLHLKRVSVAMQSKKFLENFGDGYHEYSLQWDNYTEEQSREIWRVWCIVFTEFFIKFPPQHLHMDEAHMEYTMGEVVKYLNDSELLLNLFSAWNNWLKKCRYPSDYGMCVMEKLLKHIPLSSMKRIDLFGEMLSVKDTSIITSHVKYVVENWDITSSEEKREIKELFMTERNDLIWIKAIALTRDNVPVKIQELLLGEIIFCKSVAEIVQTLRKNELLECCLNIYCGYPQPLWANGYHHSNYKFWDAVIAEVLKREIIDKAYEIALREFINCEYNNERRFNKLSADIWNSILLDQNKREKVFFWLLKISSSSIQSNKELWDKYFSNCSNQEMEDAYIKIAEVIEPLEYHQIHSGYIMKEFDKKMIFDKIYPLLENDSMIKSICELAWTFYDGAIKYIDESERETELHKNSKVLEEMIEYLYENKPPRMQLTNLLVKNTMKKILLSSKRIDEIIEIRRCKLIDIANEKTKTLDDHYELNCWNTVTL